MLLFFAVVRPWRHIHLLGKQQGLQQKKKKKKNRRCQSRPGGGGNWGRREQGGGSEGRPGWLGEREAEPADPREEGHARAVPGKRGIRQERPGKPGAWGRRIPQKRGKGGPFRHRGERTRGRVLATGDEDGNAMAICLDSELKIQKEEERIDRDVSFLQLKVKVFCHQWQLKEGEGVVLSTPFLLSRPPSVSPLSFCTLSNERRRVRKVKVQEKDKPLFARKRNQPARGFSPCISEAGECDVGRFPVLPCQSHCGNV